MRLVTFSLGVLALGGALSAETALAGNVYGTAYVGLRSSYVWTDDGETRSNPAIDPYDYNETYDDGYAAGLEIGWVIADDFRLGVEGEYRHADISGVTIVRDDSLAPPLPALPPPPYPVGTVVDAGGDAEMGTAMVNLFYDFNMIDPSFVPYIGAGLGGAYVDYSITDPNSSITFQGKDATWVFAYQLMAGVAFPIGDGMSMSVGYKYFRTEDFSYVNSLAGTMQTNITQQSVDVGLQFHL
jgi:opacity protein-like surface antigen